jgi:dephospho-CoA kinase
MLRDLGAKVLDADALARDEQLRGTVGYSAIVQQFGTEILGPDREIDRRKLADVVFADPRRLAQLERIVHPRVIARVLEARAMLPDDAILVVEAIKLVETSLRSICDRIWVVQAERSALVARLAGRGLSEDQVLARMAHQAGADDLHAAADIVLRNDGDRDALRAAVSTAWSGVRAPSGRSPTG